MGPAQAGRCKLHKALWAILSIQPGFLGYLMLVVFFPGELDMRETGDRGGDDINELKSSVVGVFTSRSWRIR